MDVRVCDKRLSVSALCLACPGGNICKVYDGAVSTPISTRQVDYKVYALGQVPRPTDDAKTNRRVDPTAKV